MSPQDQREAAVCPVPPHALDPSALPRWRSTGTKGAASELLACVHLMRQGFSVYRCESPAAPFDLVAYRDGQLLRVEVKSINWGSALRVGPSSAWPVNDEWDLLVIVDPDDGSCLEVETHDANEGRNMLRAKYGFPPLIRRMTTPQVGIAPLNTFPRRIYDRMRRDPKAEWTYRTMREVLVDDGWISRRPVETEHKIVVAAFRELESVGLIVRGRAKGSFHCVTPAPGGFDSDRFRAETGGAV